MLIIEEIVETREANMAEWFPLPGGLDSPHPGHGKHLCVAHVMNWIQTNLEEYKDIVRDGKYVCKRLTWMVQVCKAVDHRNGGVFCKAFYCAVCICPYYNSM